MSSRLAACSTARFALCKARRDHKSTRLRMAQSPDAQTTWLPDASLSRPRIFTRPSHHGERAFYFCTCVMERRGPLMRSPLRSHPPSRQSEERIHGHAHGVRTGHVCRTHENGVPINFWQCEKPIGAGVLLKTCVGCDAATITAEAGDWARFRHEARVPYCVVVGDVSGSRPNARNLYKSDLHSGPDVLQRHWCVAEHDDGQWNEQFGVERRFRWRQFERRQSGRRSRRPAIDPQRPMRRRFPHRCLGWLQLNGRPTLVRCVTPAEAPSLTAAHSN